MEKQQQRKETGGRASCKRKTFPAGKRALVVCSSFVLSLYNFFLLFIFLCYFYFFIITFATVLLSSARTRGVLVVSRLLHGDLRHALQ